MTKEQKLAVFGLRVLEILETEAWNTGQLSDIATSASDLGLATYCYSGGYFKAGTTSKAKSDTACDVCGPDPIADRPCVACNR